MEKWLKTCNCLEKNTQLVGNYSDVKKQNTNKMKTERKRCVRKNTMV